MGGSKEGLQYVFAETLGFRDEVKAVGVRMKPGKRVEITGRLLYGEEGEVVDTKDILQVWHDKKVRFADKESGIVDWEGVRADRKRNYALNPRKWDRKVQEGIKTMDMMIKWDRCYLSDRINKKIEVLDMRLGTVLKKLAMIALVNEKDVGEMLEFLASGINFDKNAVTKKNVAKLLKYFQGEEGLMVGNLDWQAVEAYGVMVKNMPSFEEFCQKEYPKELLRGKE